MSVIKSFFLEANNGLRSYANLREKDMVDNGWWDKSGIMEDVDIELPAESKNEASAGPLAQGKELKDIFDKTSRTIYNWDEVDKEMKRGEKVEKLIYTPGKYYEVVYPNTVEKDYNHTVYVFCSYADFKGSKVHIYDAEPNKNFVEEGLFLYKYTEPTTPVAPTTTLFHGDNDREALKVEEKQLEFEKTASLDTYKYTVDIYKVNDKGSPEEYKKDGEVENDVTKIPLSQPGALFLLKYNLQRYEVQDITKTIKILTNDESKNKDTLLTKYSEIRYPYQYTAEKHTSLVNALTAFKKKVGDNHIKNFSTNYLSNQNGVVKVNDKYKNAGGAYDTKLDIVSIDKTTFNDIEFLKNKIDFIYNTVKLKTNYKYDSIKWLRFITKYLNYDSIIENITTIPLIKRREELLSAFKKYGVTDKQKQELYCFDLYDKDFHKLIHLDVTKPTLNGVLLLEVKDLFKDKYTDTTTGKDIGYTEEEARKKWQDILKSNNPFTNETEKDEFDMLWERRNNFQSINREEKQLGVLQTEADSNKGKFTVIKNATTNNWVGKSDVDGKEYDLVKIGINSEGEAFGSDKNYYIFKNNAGSNEQATGVLGFERSSGIVYTDWGARKGYRMAEHLQNLLIGITSGIKFGFSEREDRINDEKFKKILGNKDVTETFKIGGKKHSRTHKKRKTLKKRSSRRRH